VAAAMSPKSSKAREIVRKSLHGNSLA